MPEVPRGLRPGGRFDDWAPARPEYVVADVDGTLVGPSAEASDGVVDAVGRVQAGGARLGFATGRMRLAVEPLWAQLRAVGPHILHNGAEVRADGRTVTSWPLERRHLEAIAGIIERLDVYAEVYVPGGYLVSSHDERARPHWEVLGRPPMRTVPPVDELDAEVLKVTFALFDGEPQGPLVEALRQAGMQAGPAGSPLTPDIHYVNATSPHADKGRALAAAAAHAGVALPAVVAIGDAANDLSMLALAGTSIAMGQAEAEILDAVHLIAPDVHGDGVAVALDVVLALRAELHG